jgi:hypothetical protein
MCSTGISGVPQRKSIMLGCCFSGEEEHMEIQEANFEDVVEGRKLYGSFEGKLEKDIACRVVHGTPS